MSFHGVKYTKEMISKILDEIKSCIQEYRYIISLNDKRIKNIKFIKKYFYNKEEIRSDLLSISVNDFCYSVQNEHKGYENEILYVFAPFVYLRNEDEEDSEDNDNNVDNKRDNKEKLTPIYTKFNIVDYENDKRTIVISFHELEKPIEYLFRVKEVL